MKSYISSTFLIIIRFIEIKGCIFVSTKLIIKNNKMALHIDTATLSEIKDEIVCNESLYSYLEEMYGDVESYMESDDLDNMREDLTNFIIAGNEVDTF